MPINESSSFQLSANAFFGIEGAGSAFGVGADYRAYISKTQEAPRGLYVSPGAGISFGDGANALNLRAQIGYQWVWDSGFALDLGLGPGYFIGLGDGVVGAFDGIVPTVTTAIGYQF